MEAYCTSGLFAGHVAIAVQLKLVVGKAKVVGLSQFSQ